MSRPGDPLAERSTFPANPLTGEIMIVEVPMAPALSLRESGFAEIVKSTTFTLTRTVWARGLLVPVTVTL